MANKKRRSISLNTKRLRGFLSEKEMSQLVLSEKLDCSPRTISNMMDGVIPHEETLQRLSKLMDLPISKLVEIKE